jgi:hypothetical protein
MYLKLFLNEISILFIKKIVNNIESDLNCEFAILHVLFGRCEKLGKE